MRQAVVAGQFYPQNKEQLEKEIKGFLRIKADKRIKAAIVPHAGIFFSGKCAGKVYSSLSFAESYVIIGVNHNGIGENISISSEDFQTPFGGVKNDSALVEEILKSLNSPEDKEAHKYEHSIEVQLPFLQLTQKNFKIVPIILKNYDLETCQKLAKIIVESAKKLKRKIIIIASSDFTHTGPNYGFFGSSEADKRAIDKILKLNTKSFFEIAKKTTICGAGAIATVIESAKLLGAKEPELLDYYTSAEIMPNENKVGYAGIVFKVGGFV